MIICSVVCKRWQILRNLSNNPDHIQESLWRRYVSIPLCFFLPTQHSCENEGSFPGQASYNRQRPNILSWFLLNATGRKRGHSQSSELNPTVIKQSCRLLNQGFWFIDFLLVLVVVVVASLLDILYVIHATIWGLTSNKMV